MSRYEGGTQIPTVAGGKTLEITGVDEAGVHIRHSLWRDTLAREHLEKAAAPHGAAGQSRPAGRVGGGAGRRHPGHLGRARAQGPRVPRMTRDLDWEAVRDRYRGGRAVRPLVGGSSLHADAEADEVIRVSQRLWRADVTRGELEVALDLLGDRPASTPAVPFSEELRRYYSGGPQVQATCSRTPNLCAVVLKDLGYLDA